MTAKSIIMGLRLLCLGNGEKRSCQFFFNHCNAKPKLRGPCKHDFSSALSRGQVIARNFDWFIMLSAPVVNGWNNNNLLLRY